MVKGEMKKAGALGLGKGRLRGA